MSILQDYRAFAVAVMVILAIVGLFWHKRKKRPKTGPVNRQAAHEKNQKAVKAAAGPDEFAVVKDESSLKRRAEKQEAEFGRFLDVIERLKQAGKIHRWSVFTFGKNLLEELERFVVEYNSRSMIQGRVEGFVSTYQWLLFSVTARAILEYSDGKGLQAIALNLIKISETYFKLNGLNGVLYRHKEHVHYNDRCEGMSVAILRFFETENSHEDGVLLPFDLCGEKEMIPADKFRREFYQEAIDHTYADAMKHVEKTNFAAQARKDQQEHEKNRRQRAKRVTRKSRRK